MHTIIGLTGSIGSGKSTVSDYLVKNHNFVEISFASTIKDIAISFGFKHHQVYGTQQQKEEINELFGFSGRVFLQKFGTEFGRDTFNILFKDCKINNGELWLKITENKILNALKTNNVVISDIRFENESNLIKKLNGKILKLERENNNTLQTHSSELQQISYDYYIKNNDNLIKLQDSIKMIFFN